MVLDGSDEYFGELMYVIVIGAGDAHFFKADPFPEGASLLVSFFAGSTKVGLIQSELLQTGCNNFNKIRGFLQNIGYLAGPKSPEQLIGFFENFVCDRSLQAFADKG
jgi:hypothetical protein